MPDLASPLTPELALRLERAEVLHLTRQVETYAQLFPQTDARLVPVGGGSAAATDPLFGRKLNHAIGVGMEAAVAPDELARVEAAVTTTYVNGT